MVQWLRIHLPVQGTWVRSLVWEDPTCHGPTKAMRHNSGAHELQLLKPVCLEPVFHNRRSHHNEKPVYRPFHHNRRKPECSNEDPAQPTIK